MRSAGRKFLFLIILSLLFLTPDVQAQDEVKADTFDIKSAAFFLPYRAPNKDFRHLFSASYYFLPADWTLFAINAPMANYSARYSLPAGFAIEGGISTIIVSNKFLLGPRWAYSKNNLHFSAGFLYGYNLGILNDFGFTTTVTGWSHIPNVAFGYSFPKSSITFNASLEYLGNFSYYTGDNVVTTDNFNLNGSRFGLTLEQRIWKERIFTFGFAINHVNFVMLAWPAFPVNNKKYFVPEVTVGITL